jgi:hypothetical protein
MPAMKSPCPICENSSGDVPHACPDAVPTFLGWLGSVLGTSGNTAERYRMPGILFVLTLVAFVGIGGVAIWSVAPSGVGDALVEEHGQRSIPGRSERAGQALALPGILLGGLAAVLVSPFFYLQRRLRLHPLTCLVVSGLVAQAAFHVSIESLFVATGQRAAWDRAARRDEAARQRHLAVLQEPVVPFSLDQEPWPRLAGTAAAPDLTALRAAADGGDPDAQVQLAYLLWTGTGTSEDHGQAVRWADRAAEAKQPDAIFFLAACEANGHEVEQTLQGSTDRFAEVQEHPELGPLARRARELLHEEFLRESRRIAAEQALRAEP